MHRFSKRIFDLLASSIGLSLLLPFFLILSVAIKLSMPGDIFFRQSRMGKNGVPFRLFKFRTMKSIQKAPEGRFNPGDRTRVTKLGSFLRKYKLDELPQLINVLIGDMSIVGPRPEIREWTEVYPSEWKIILSVKPGITDNASIAYRDEEEILSKADDPHEIYRNLILPRKLALYISYVQNNNLLKDIGIIFRTLITVIYK